MKKSLFIFIATCHFICLQSIHAQVPAMFCNPAAPCAGPTATAQVGLVSAIPGAVLYTIASTGNATLTPSAPNGSVVSAIFTPGTYTLTVYPFSMSGTIPVLIPGAIMSMTVNVGSGPTTTIVSTSSNLCIGGSATLTAFGATSYTWSIGAVGQSVVVQPFSPTCFSVAANNPGTCFSINSICLNVFGPQSLTVVPGTTNVCQGSSQTFTAFGATTYTWDNSVNSSTYNILPNAITMHTLVGTNALGCTNSYTFSVWADTTCANVWPGDANSDGVVGTTDVLEVGLQATSTGPSRTPGGNAYTSQYATAWTGTISSGKNKCHADCNGDGVVNIADTIAIYNNFSLTHAFKPLPAAAGDQISLVPALSQVQIGNWNTMTVLLGSSSNQVSSHGVEFELDFDNTKIAPDSIYLVYTNSAFTTGNQYIYFRKTNFNNGKIYAAITRAGGTNVNVGGPIAVLHYKASSQLTDASTLNFGISNSQKMDATGNLSSVTGDTRTITATKNLVGIARNTSIAAVSIYPNPAKDLITIKGKESEQYTLKIFDVTGRKIEQRAMTSEATLSVAGFDNGLYLFEISNANGSKVERVTVVH